MAFLMLCVKGVEGTFSEAVSLGLRLSLASVQDPTLLERHLMLFDVGQGEMVHSSCAHSSRDMHLCVEVLTTQ